MSIQNKEVVYETEDVPVEETPSVEEQFVSEEVEKVHVDIDAVLKQFGGRLLNADNVDFSDSIFPWRRKGFGSSSYVLEVVGPKYDEPETLEQKFNRLRCELDELQSAVDNGENDESAARLSKSDVAELSDVLKAAIVMKSDAATSRKGDAKSTSHSRRVDAVPQDPVSSDLVSLESRIKRIEGIVGGDRASSRVQTGPLFEVVDDLRLRVETLNPAYLDSVKTKLSALIATLNEYDDKKSKLHTDELEEKISKLYDLVLKWDSTCTHIPSLVKRLQSLSKLHEQAEVFSAQLNEMSVLKQHVEKKLENDRMTLFELRKDTAKLVTDFSSKIATLEQQVGKK